MSQTKEDESIKNNVKDEDTKSDSKTSDVDEITQKQKDLKVCDDEAGATAATGAAPEDESEEATGEVEEDDDDDDDFNVKDLQEREKNMTEEELKLNKENAEKLKLQGNELFKNEDVTASIQMYTEALILCPTSCTKERAILYGNRAAAKIKLNSKKPAISDCNKAIKLWPDYVRALLRRAKLLEGEDKLDEALEDYKRVYELDPGQREAREAMVRLPPIIQERNERLKEEMLSKLKDLGNMVLKPFGLSTSNFQMQKDPNTGSYSINFNQQSS